MAERMAPSLTCGEATDLAAPFVLDALAPEDMAAVREHLVTCASPHPEFAELGSVIPALGRSVATVRPPAALGARIIAAARAEVATTGSESPTTTRNPAMPAPEGPTAAPLTGREPVAAPLVPGRSRQPVFARFRAPQWALAAAAVLVIVVLGGWNLQLEAQVSDLGSYRSGVASVLDAAAASGGRIALLRSASGSGATGIAAVDPAGRLVLAVRDLPPTSGTAVYEAWLIGPTGTPAPAGSFTVGATQTGELVASIDPNSGSVAIAITRESGPGATTPTLPILLQGRPQSSGA